MVKCNTLSIPRICIFAIISAVNSIVTVVSQIKVTYCKAGCRSNVFGVFRETDANDTKAHIRINRLTHNYTEIHNQ